MVGVSAFPAMWLLKRVADPSHRGKKPPDFVTEQAIWQVDSRQAKDRNYFDCITGVLEIR